MCAYFSPKVENILINIAILDRKKQLQESTALFFFPHAFLIVFAFALIPSKLPELLLWLILYAVEQMPALWDHSSPYPQVTVVRV